METIVLIARLLHSWTRWILLIVAVIALIVFILGLLQKKDWSVRANSLLNGYSALFGLQWLFGAILLIAYGSIVGFGQRHFWEHLVIQTVAMLIANAHHGWRKRALPDSTRWRNGLLVIVVSLILAVVGVVLLPVDMQWRFFVP